jgi:hypothetical protein
MATFFGWPLLLRSSSGEEALLCEEYMMLYVAVLARTVLAATVRVYVAGVRSLHIEATGRVPWVFEGSAYRLSRVIAGFERRQAKVPRKRAPVTLALLREWRRHFDLARRDHAAIWAALLLGFYGLLRKSEFTVADGTVFDPKRHLSRGDVMFLAAEDGRSWTGVEVHIKFSKAQQFGCDHGVPIGFVGGPLCPVLALRHMVSLDPAPASAPLFRDGRGAPLSSRHLGAVLARLVRATPSLKAVWLTLHSLRVGGAVALQEAGASELVLQLAGRWSSHAYRAYLRHSRTLVIGWARRMAGGRAEL